MWRKAPSPKAWRNTSKRVRQSFALLFLMLQAQHPIHQIRNPSASRGRRSPTLFTSCGPVLRAEQVPAEELPDKAGCCGSADPPLGGTHEATRRPAKHEGAAGLWTPLTLAVRDQWPQNRGSPD